MKLSNSRIGMVVAAAITAAALAPSVVLGYSVNTQGTTRGTLNTSSGGDTLLFPIYTTENGATTSLSVTNTSEAQTIAAKIRFREQDHCVDALDFYVILSPTDKFDFSVGMGDNGRPVMAWKDNSCVIGPNPGQNNQTRTQGFPPPWTPYATTDAQLASGHLEVLGLVDLSGTTLATHALHGANGIPSNCNKLRTVFGDPVEVYRLNTGVYGALESAGNVLVGRYVITVPNLGLEAGGDAIAIRDSNLADRLNNTDPMWHVTAQSGKDCSWVQGQVAGALGPNCRTAEQYAWDKREWDHPHLGELQDLAGFQLAMGAGSVSGDWSNNPVNYVGMDWTFSFPAKYAYLDYVNGKWRLLEHPKGQLTNTTADFVWYNNGQAGNTGTSTDLTLTTDLHVFDTEEQESGEILQVSPGGSPTLDMPYCVNTFTLSTGSDDPRPSYIKENTGPYARKVIDFDKLTTSRGWAKMNISWPAGAVDGQNGASTGIIWTVRATEDPTINNASITELQKNPGL